MGAPKGNKNSTGRKPRYKKEYDEQARKLCLLGATDSELADFFSVTETTINNWKLRHSSFFESIRAGKVLADMEVANSTYNRALGYDYIEEQAHKLRNSTGHGQYTEKMEIVPVKRHMPADPKSQHLWLLNRRPDKWRDRKEHKVESTSVNHNVEVSAEEARDINKALEDEY